MQQSGLIGRMAPQIGWFVQWQTLNGSLPLGFTDGGRSQASCWQMPATALV